MYQALYRKWRPRTFSEVVGQEHITATLQRQVAEGRTAHAYLFTGTRGTGKTTCARILAKAVNCLHPVDGAPCCECEACRGIDSGSLLDVTELDAASNNGVDQVRALREEAVYTPSVLQKRVYIIDEVHMLSTAAFNALLKILEEPPEHLLFILATTELHKVPATILSRCQRFSFKRILPSDMERQLLHIAQAEGIDLTPDGAEILSRMANGALRDALSLLDQCRAIPGAIDSRAVLDVLGLAGSVQTLQLMTLLLRRDAAGALQLFDRLYCGGKDVAALLGELSDLGRELTIEKAAPEGGAALLSGLYDRKTLQELGGDEPLRRFLYITAALQVCLAALPGSPRPRTDAELCLLRLTDESLSGDTGALEARLARLENAVMNGAAPGPARSAPRSGPLPGANANPEPEERPPLPEDVPPETASPTAPDTPAPPRHEAPPQDVSGGSAGDDSVWAQLVDHFKGRLPVNYRVFLNMVSGTLEGDCLRVLCKDDFVKTSLDNSTVLGVLREVSSQKLGRPIRPELAVGAPAAEKPAPRRPADPPARASLPAQESSTDALDALADKGRQLKHFTIKGE